ncbi:MAG: DUF1565 domain-containing protein [bacterium]|nr:DUF1565 domain-containing protein [bacterium]
MLLASTFVLLCPVLGGDLYVDGLHATCATGNGSEASPFCTIGEAIAAAQPGDTIHVAPGTYCN